MNKLTVDQANNSLEATKMMISGAKFSCLPEDSMYLAPNSHVSLSSVFTSHQICV